MCFGDLHAFSILLLAYFHFIIPLLTSPLAPKVLNSLYVDDSLSGHRCREDLEQVLEKLASLGFHPKFVYYNWKTPPKEVSEDLVVFHQRGNISSDEVLPGINFNLHAKNRGVSKGCNLVDMTKEEISKLKISKTLLA